MACSVTVCTCNCMLYNTALQPHYWPFKACAMSHCVALQPNCAMSHCVALQLTVYSTLQVTAHPVSQYHVQEGLNPQQHHCENLKSHRNLFLQYCCISVGQVSSVGIATHYWLDGPEIESQWGRDFPHPSRRTPGTPSLLYSGYRVFHGGKRVRAWFWPPIPI
jgi:hypothetical protein